MTEFQNDRAAYLERYDVRHVASQVLSEQAVKNLDADLPSDIHLVFYVAEDGGVLIDAVRAYKKVDVFDAYHDAGKVVLDIKTGYGRIKPKLYTPRDLSALTAS